MLGREIRRRRLARRWTQESLAERAGLSPHYLSTLETGRRDPSVSTIESIAGALGIATGELFGTTKGLSAAGGELARRFDKLPEEAQRVVLDLIRLLERPRRL